MTQLAAFMYARGLIPEDATMEVAIQEGKRLQQCLDYLLDKIQNMEEHTEEKLQFEAYEAGKVSYADNLRFWFKCIYQILMDQDSGARLGQFILLIGVPKTLSRIYSAMNGDIFYGRQ